MGGGIYKKFVFGNKELFENYFGLPNKNGKPFELVVSVVYKFQKNYQETQTSLNSGLLYV